MTQPLIERQLRIHAEMVTHCQVIVWVPGTTKTQTYPTVEAFLGWLSDVHKRVVKVGGVLAITTPVGLHVHPADLMLRAAIGESSAGPCLTA